MTDTHNQFELRTEHHTHRGPMRWWVTHPDWNGSTKGYTIMLQGVVSANDRTRFKIVLKEPAIHIAPRKEDRGKPRHLVLCSGTKVISEFEAPRWLEKLARQVKDRLDTGKGTWQEADSLIGKAFNRLDDARVA